MHLVKRYHIRRRRVPPFVYLETDHVGTLMLAAFDTRDMSVFPTAIAIHMPCEKYEHTANTASRPTKYSPCIWSTFSLYPYSGQLGHRRRTTVYPWQRTEACGIAVVASGIAVVASDGSEMPE